MAAAPDARRRRGKEELEMTPGVNVAFLRGINVGGKNKLPMKRLVELFLAAGCEDVRTWIQSGNVVFAASPALAKRLPTTIGTALREQLGLEVPVVTRTAVELRAAVRANPFLDQGAEERALSVGFLADRPSRARVSKLDPQRSPPDAFSVRGREVYLHCPNGVARSKLTNAYFDSTLATISTFRNWKTTSKLLEMVGE
jgi:uncharacterized protein (DUF1697 family)